MLVLMSAGTGGARTLLAISSPSVKLSSAWRKDLPREAGWEPHSSCWVAAQKL